MQMCLAFAMSTFLLLALLGQSVAKRTVLPAWGDEETKQLVYEQIGRCRDPGNRWTWNGQAEAEWEPAFGEAVKQARADPNGPHAQTLQRPLKSTFGFLASFLPYHAALQLTTDRMKKVSEGQFSPDSHCFAFDYKNFSPGDADPHGCGFFKKSFQPLQKLRQCITHKLESSINWKAYKAVANKIRAAERDGRKDRIDLSIRDDNGATIANATGKWEVAYDSIRRADEMVKSVSFKDWQELDMKSIKKEVQRKIKTTVTTNTKQSVLDDDTIAAIRRDCFLISDDVSADNQIPRELATLKNAMPCYDLMWDQVEVPGAPQQPFVNAINMWEPPLLSTTTVKQEHYVPPVCARAAVALVADRQKRAPGKYKALSCTHKCRSWRSCMHPSHFNCICFACCFQNALRRLCEIDDGCCDKPPA
eukprot:TRINITY_DN19373_c0_g1_i1.p1 TRINITY_DN19373_c0_g1~~TRINITY_DN19373_c0_g1_i1.p1  ORF type:complete len:419 (+),score=64.83 TRINITY_DN19373_c0_g1_i1:46-1302(+)